LPFALHGRDTFFLKLGEMQRLRVLGCWGFGEERAEKCVLSEEEGSRRRLRCHDEEVYGLFSSKDITRLMKSRMMSLPVRVAGTGETEVTIEKEANWETQGLDGTILFKWILKKYDRRE